MIDKCITKKYQWKLKENYICTIIIRPHVTERNQFPKIDHVDDRF